MRQIGVGTPDGAGALAIFPQLLYDEWMTGSLRVPLARIKVEEKNCFGMIEWNAVCEAASRFLPRHTAAAAGNIETCPMLNRYGLSMPKDRGAGQGDVDGPWSAAWPLERWQQRREEASLRSKRRAPSLGLA